MVVMVITIMLIVLQREFIPSLTKQLLRHPLSLYPIQCDQYESKCLITNSCNKRTKDDRATIAYHESLPLTIISCSTAADDDGD